MLKTKNVRHNLLNIQAPDIGALSLILYIFSNYPFMLQISLYKLCGDCRALSKE